MKKEDQPKLIAACVLLVLAGGIVAWSMGAFDSLFSKPPPSVESTMTEKEKVDFQKQVEEAKKRPPSTRG